VKVILRNSRKEIEVDGRRRVKDSEGQNLASSFLDYPLPSAREMPRIEMFHLTTPSPINLLGVKGAGEAGTLPVPAAVAGAVEDALRPFGVRVNRMPLIRRESAI
jgi:carbon-monoxide dehydrogenase large subunit